MIIAYTTESPKSITRKLFSNYRRANYIFIEWKKNINKKRLNQDVAKRLVCNIRPNSQGFKVFSKFTKNCVRARLEIAWK